MKISEARRFFNLSNKRLRRARRLYVRLCIPAMEKHGNKVVQAMAIKMMENGLYSNYDKSGRCARQGIGGHYFHITKHQYQGVTSNWFPWAKWCDIVNWGPYYGNYRDDRPFNRKPKFKITAVISDIKLIPESHLQEIWE